VFVLKDQQTLVAMQPAHFAAEDDFQRLLANFPALLSGDQIGGRGWRWESAYHAAKAWREPAAPITFGSGDKLVS
jgi:hypothetical protein